jgi:hypothetical protein
MKTFTIGEPAAFAIESGIAKSYERLSQRALGFFVIHVGGVAYGVRAPDATLLACSFDAVQRRIERRGRHIAPFGEGATARAIAEAFLSANYTETPPGQLFFDVPADEFLSELAAHELVWAPDGDAAFDDGGHVLQFDVDGRVRLVAFKNGNGDLALREAWLDEHTFYDILEKWRSTFEAVWRAALKSPEGQ